jgi:ABC-2 type transport system ATP-binding protein
MSSTMACQQRKQLNLSFVEINGCFFGIIDLMKAIIEVNKLVKQYAGASTNAVDGITFHVEPGEFFGFLGPNGAGKSTTMNILVNLVSKTGGSVKIDGFEVSEKPFEVYRQVGYALQEVGLDDSATAREMLQLHGRLYHLPKEKIEQRIAFLLKLTDLEKVADQYTSTYSGGMRRRFDLALSLIHEPKVLFLDEPTVGLDPQARRVLWRYLKELNKRGMTIFLTTHFLEEADALCNRLAIVDKGKIVAEGTPDVLKKKYKVSNLDDVFLLATGHELESEEAIKGVR